MATKNGIVKRSSLSMYSKPRKGGIYAIDINEEDELIQARVTNGEQDIILAKIMGTGVADVAAAKLAYDKATEQSVGTLLNW